MPYGELLSASREALLSLFPELSSKKDSEGVDKIVDIFVGDVLSEKKIKGGMFFHRLAPSEQRKELENININDLFKDLSESLVSFYSEKIKKIK